MQLLFWSVLQEEAAVQIDGLLTPPEVKLFNHHRVTALHKVAQNYGFSP
jgi:hypothetical protein